jgi:phosphatidylinositol-3-phosphatase
MKNKLLLVCLLAASFAGTAFAQSEPQGSVPKGVPHLDHVFLIMMENHGYFQVLNNPNEPYLNSLIANKKVNLATNYFAVGHPSLTNYLEVVGGSNFGIRSDNSPNWGSTTCTPNIASGLVNADDDLGKPPIPIETTSICPISGTGTDAATPAVDNWNETTTGVFNFLADLDGVKSVPAAPVLGETIADQLAHHGLSWKTYQESLPLGSPYGVNSSDGTVSNLTNFENLEPLITSSSYVQDYAVKHNPFAYFKSVQEGSWNDSLNNVVGFDGPRGLYADLADDRVPSFSFIAPNQCDDQHGRGNGDALCAFDPGLPPGNATVGTQAGLNGGLILRGDVSIQRLVEAIKASRVWNEGRDAIVIVWDENDYSGLLNATQGLFPPQNQNKVVLTVETNYAGDNSGVQSATYYTSFSILKSLEAGFGLPCLNHACDATTNVMSDLFAGPNGNRDHDGDDDRQ